MAVIAFLYQKFVTSTIIQLNIGMTTIIAISWLPLGFHDLLPRLSYIEFSDDSSPEIQVGLTCIVVLCGLCT